MSASDLHDGTHHHASDRDGSGLSSLMSGFEAILVILTGMSICWFAISDNYSLLMDPKFRLLTLAGALSVCGMGIAAVSHRRSAGPSGSLAIVVLAAIVLLGKPYSEDSASAVTTALRLPDAQNVEDPDFPMKDIRDLTAELEEEGDTVIGVPLSAMGTVKHLPSPSSGGAGQVALMRSYMVCCAADALALGFRVDGEDIAKLKDSDWVVVRGQLAKLPEPDPIPPFRLGTATFSVVNESYIIESTEVVPLTTTLPSLVEQLSAENTAIFRAALEETGLLKKLDRKGPFTVFAPINEAFGDASEGELPQEEWLSSHLISGKYMEQDLFEEDSLNAINGREVPIRAVNGRLILGNSRMLLTNVEARNGVIHIIYPGLARTP